MKNRSKIGCLVLVLLGVSLSVMGYYALIFSPTGRADRGYEALAVGQTRDEVMSLFGRAPDYSCFYRSSEIVYFFRHGWTTFYVGGGGPYYSGGKALYKEVDGKRVPVPPEEMPARIATKKEIPYVYDAYQILIGEHGLVQAFTHNGETTRIHTVRGDIEGDHFSVLDESFFGEETPSTSTSAALETVGNKEEGKRGG